MDFMIKTKTPEKYQNLFNNTLSKIRIATNATGNKALGDVIVKILFDFSDELKNMIGDPDNDYSEKR